MEGNPRVSGADEETHRTAGVMSTVDIANIATNLELREPGTWFAKTSAPISYPEEANAWCYEVEPNSFWFQHRNACIVEVMKNFPPAGTLFDVGGGNGFVSLGLKNAGFETVLVEPGIHGIDNAKRRGLNPLICSRLEQAGFKPGSIPAVGLFDVIEHIADDRAFLRTVHSHLQRNGQIYLTVPAYKLLWSSEDHYAGHFRRYTLKSISQTLTDAGFQIDFATYLFSILPLPIFLLRALPSRFGFRKGATVDQQKQEHKASGGFTAALLEKVWQRELSRLRNKKRIRCGSSCLVIASKA